jgi:hypothetical protein
MLSEIGEAGVIAARSRNAHVGLQSKQSLALGKKTTQSRTSSVSTKVQYVSILER